MTAKYQRTYIAITILLCVLLILAVFFPLAAHADDVAVPTDAFAGGTGTEDDPFIIETVYQLNRVRDYAVKEYREVYFPLLPDDPIGKTAWSGYHFLLANDINLKLFLDDPQYVNGGWVPIGDQPDYTLLTEYYGGCFAGTFDGGGHTISGLFINQPLGESTGKYGLFGELSGATVKNLTVECSPRGITGAMAAGILAGKAGETFQEIDGETNRVTIENVKTVGNIVTGRVAADKTKTLPGDIAGGIIGSAWGCDFSGCEFNGAVTSYADIGGIVGLGMDCTIRDSVANVALTLTDASKTAAEAGAGGIAGVFGISEENAAGMENCFANVTAPDNRVAGIFGIGKTGGDAAAPAFLPVMINCLYDGSPEVTRFTFVTMALPEGCGRVSVEDVTEPTVAPPFQWWWLIVGVAGGLVMSAAYILVHYKKNAMRSAVYVAAAKTTSKDETIVGEVPTRWQGIDAEKAELQGIINGFSDKEKTVAKLICDGYNRKQLAEKMGLAEGTVKYYIANILASANCTNRIEFISKFRGFFE